MLWCCERRESPPLKTELYHLLSLWQLYQKLVARVSPNCCVLPPVMRALTELFYTAENLAVVSSVVASNVFLCA